MEVNSVDIKENEIAAKWPEVLNVLLKDQTKIEESGQGNIFWATDNYSYLGEGFKYNDPITIKHITGKNGEVIKPRAEKKRELQQQRSREMAEVFTPSWICNKQNNLIDSAWFGSEDVFNTEVDNPDGTHTWIPTEGKIEFPNVKGEGWKDYVKDIRMEITCGEAPYLVSRYDTVTGEEIPLERRIGLLDRKLRVVGENTDTPDVWFDAAEIAFQSIYGYEWQGDNLLLAREALLYTFIDYYKAKFGGDPQESYLIEIAEIISWNIWQMDGLKGVIPNSCGKKKSNQPRFEGMEGIEEKEEYEPCEACKSGKGRHNGTYALVCDWGATKEDEKIIPFVKVK